MQVNFSWKTLPILIIPFTKVFGSSRSKLWVPQWTKTYSTDGETDKASTLHKKFQVLSPEMPQFSALYSSKYFFHTVWYLLRLATIEFPINSTKECNIFARISCLLCVFYKPKFLLRPVGVVAKSYDWL